MEKFHIFLLDTLPENIRNSYIKKFSTSIEFWQNTGGGLSEIVIRELLRKGYKIELNGVSNHTKIKRVESYFWMIYLMIRMILNLPKIYQVGKECVIVF